MPNVQGGLLTDSSIALEQTQEIFLQVLTLTLAYLLDKKLPINITLVATYAVTTSGVVCYIYIMICVAIYTLICYMAGHVIPHMRLVRLQHTVPPGSIEPVTQR